MCIYITASMLQHVDTYSYVSLYQYLHIYPSICVYIHIYIYMYTYMAIYIHTRVYIHIYILIYICVCARRLFICLCFFCSAQRARFARALRARRESSCILKFAIENEGSRVNLPACVFRFHSSELASAVCLFGWWATGAATGCCRRLGPPLKAERRRRAMHRQRRP